MQNSSYAKSRINCHISAVSKLFVYKKRKYDVKQKGVSFARKLKKNFSIFLVDCRYSKQSVYIND